MVHIMRKAVVVLLFSFVGCFIMHAANKKRVESAISTCMDMTEGSNQKQRGMTNQSTINQSTPPPDAGPDSSAVQNPVRQSENTQSASVPVPVSREAGPAAASVPSYSGSTSSAVQNPSRPTETAQAASVPVRVGRVAGPSAATASLANPNEDLISGSLDDVLIDDSGGRLGGTDDTFNVPAKRKAVVQLVDDGYKYLMDNPLDRAFSAFTHNRQYIRGELYLFVFDASGICYAHGQEANMIWNNFWNLKDPYGTLIVQSIINKAKAGGGWVTYQWRNSTKVSYVRAVNKGGKLYAIGCGYYPHSKPDAVVNLVRGAVAYFTENVNQRDFLPEEIFSTITYPQGRFVLGDLYLYALDFDGIIRAQGDRPGLIGSNAIAVQDSNGHFVNREIIEKLKNATEGIWIRYKSKNAVKIAYAEKVTDKKGKSYFIACGYYPDANQQAVIDLVKSGYNYMKRNGKTRAAEEFSDRRHDTFRYGDLSIFVYDLKGVLIGSGSNPDFIGVNQLNLQDEDGRFYVQELIKKAQQGGGWVDFKMKNAFQSAYVELIDLGIEQFVIGSGLYPITKRETALLLVRSASGYLAATPEEQAFADFSSKTGKFLRGDLMIFTIDGQGICRSNGDDYQLIWRNLLDAKDDAGKPYIRMMINLVRQGSGQLTYIVNGMPRIAFVDRVDKNGESYIVGSGFYR